MPANIPTILLNNGYQLPVLGLGTAVRRDLGEADKTYEAVRAAIRAGYRLIDTAAAYGTEVEVGRAIKDAVAAGDVTRPELVILTKVFMDSMSRPAVMESARKSVENLGLEYVDILLVHWPMPVKAGTYLNEPDYSVDIHRDTWGGMEDVFMAGLAKTLGVSNYNAKQIEALRKVSSNFGTNALIY